MIEENGTIIATSGSGEAGTATIKAKRSEACEGCGTKDMCHDSDGESAKLEALNPVGAKVGDEVNFTVGTGTVIRAGLLIYLFPLIGFIIGVVLVQALADVALPKTWNADLASAALGMALMILTYLAISIYSKRSGEDLSRMPKITSIIKSKSN